MIELPGRGWAPRPYQWRAWDYLQRGGKRAVLVWHRRSGKDDLCLHWAACAAMQRPGNYWHMLPEAGQARKALWDAVDENAGIRRIDIALPKELRVATKEQEMQVKLINGSTWQVVGSDNYDSLVGSPPVGLVFSEYPLANPAAWAYLRPILANNGGFAIFAFTPRGKNHAWKLYSEFQGEPDWFVQRLGADDTGVFSPAVLARERSEMARDYGEAMGGALFRQEYYCDFSAASIGSVYGSEMAAAEREGRVSGEVLPDMDWPVSTAWDLGFDDATAVWFFQVFRGEIRIIDYYESSGQNIKHYSDYLLAKPYKYEHHWLPHDAKPKTLASGGRSIIEQLWEHGIKGRIAPTLDVQDGIQAVRRAFPLMRFNSDNCKKGLEAVDAYHYSYSTDRAIASAKPVHDWSSHAADALRILSVAYIEYKPVPVADKRILGYNDMTLEQLWEKHEREYL